ncbi:hypothetical protein DEFDS_P120 (plasmid) [Deferribacter desulfuricans SSM1]|uniref:Uncharacterized protein n=1 Tax=Deferribacter desulfuricans (strain DSM 14783 / JCM 11476 / NBRC 101012 / SSM1) TaxID=639282 RepID=D3PEV0_DEFDS|nr:hypothetical protein [Deferribacter desulfuricans]BAI81742.1 hypothetical protein DEFDS_P120 [Deferribacter desulfuricans SSM1]
MDKKITITNIIRLFFLVGLIGLFIYLIFYLIFYLIPYKIFAPLIPLAIENPVIYMLFYIALILFCMITNELIKLADREKKRQEEIQEKMNKEEINN